MHRKWYLPILAMLVALMSACSILPGNNSGAQGQPRAEVRQPPDTALLAAQNHAKQLAADLAQVRQDQQVRGEIWTITDRLAQVRVRQGKVTDYSFCRAIPQELTRFATYQSLSAFMDTLYRGRCVYYVQSHIADLKYSGKREEPLQPRKKP